MLNLQPTLISIASLQQQETRDKRRKLVDNRLQENKTYGGGGYITVIYLGHLHIWQDIKYIYFECHFQKRLIMSNCIPKFDDE